METGYLNFHDEEHFSTMSSYDIHDTMLDCSDSSLLDMSSLIDQSSKYSNYDLWDVANDEEEHNGDIATFPGPVNTSSRVDNKEYYNSVLNKWQEELGTLQNSDSDEIYDSIEPMTEDLHGMDMFDESSFDGDNISSSKKLDKTQTKKSKSAGKKLVGKDLSLGQYVNEEEESKDSFMIKNVNEEDEAEGLLNKTGLTSLEDNLNDDFRIEVEDDCIDVETITGSEQIPVLEAGDVTSLLEQFEASEIFNSGRPNKQSYLDNHLFTMANTPITSKSNNNPTHKTSAVMSHQNIIDALPKEVIERIKASGRKKAIPVIPAMPSKKQGRAGTRMQDAGAALSRNKLLKLVSSSSVTGESIQLDHDYCSATNSSPQTPEVVPPRSFYHSDASDYLREESKQKCLTTEKVYARLPDYYLLLAAQSGIKKESDSRKDSGLESGDLSDASEEMNEKTNVSYKPVCSERVGASASNTPSNKPASVVTVHDKIVTINGKDINLGSIMQNVNKALVKIQGEKRVASKSNKDVPMVSVLKRNSPAEETAVPAEVVDSGKKEKVDEPKKRKLNLLEYRSRVKVLDRPRGSCESSRASSPVNLDTPTLEEAKQIFEQATQMLINAKGQINGESFALLKRTLEKQAAIKMPFHEVQEVMCQVVKEKKEEERQQVIVESAAVKTEMIEDATVVDMEIEEEHEIIVEFQSAHQVTGEIEDGVLEVVEVPETPSIEVPSVSQEKRKEETSKETSRDRSRRQYRARRANSSSSSSSSNSRDSRRKPSETERDRYTNKSCSRSHSSSSSRSRSRSNSLTKPRGYRADRVSRSHYDSSYRNRRSGSNHSQKSHSSYRSWRRSRSPLARGPEYQLTEVEKERQVEERRVIYVGRIDEGMTKAELRTRFETFGPIVDISVHFREQGDNYGFVTFAYKVDAYAAVEQGKKDPSLGQFDLSFGGRRAFCKTRYSDLDVGRGEEEYGYSSHRSLAPRPRLSKQGVNFDDLLREALKSKKEVVKTKA